MEKNKFSLQDKEPKISEETALAEVQKILEHYDIDIDDIKNPDEKALKEQALEKMQKAFMFGKLELVLLNSEFNVKQNFIDAEKNEASIVYKELKGLHKISMDRVETKAIYSRIYELLGSMSGLGSAGITKLKGKDLSIAESLGFLFLGV